jgi:trehalose 6-phosphate synthase
MGGCLVSRLIVVSNRVAIPDLDEPRQAGGLVVAVNAALKQREGVWFGWSGRVGTDDSVATPTVVHRRKRTFVTVDLSESDFQEYYNGFANRVLWPIFHYRLDLAEFTSLDLGGYLRVNAAFAKALSGFIARDDVVWIHDYHLLPLAKKLREHGHDNPIGFFLHTPCPPPDILEALPQHPETVGTLSHYDLVGVQTEHDAANIERYLENLGGGTERSSGSSELTGRKARVQAFPVGITTAAFARAARNSKKLQLVEELRESLGGKRLILGVDRLDYSKGIPHRIRAFCHFLDQNPNWVNKVTLLQVTPKSRIEVPEYRDIDREVTRSWGRLTAAMAMRRGRRSATSIVPILANRTRGVLPLGAGRPRNPIARWDESCRQGVRCRSGPRRPGRSRTLAVCWISREVGRRTGG